MLWEVEERGFTSVHATLVGLYAEQNVRLLEEDQERFTDVPLATVIGPSLSFTLISTEVVC